VDAPLVVDVKRGSLDDGPGIRTVVFFKGCPLRCAWCQNPETLDLRAEVQRLPSSCIGCRSCTAACPVDRARPAPEGEDAERSCRVCGACVDACPSAARRIAGEVIGEEELAARLLRDRVFWVRSGGGVTLSGGEPTLFSAAVGRLAARLRAEGVHVLLETCGLFPWESFARDLLPHLSAIYYDLKLADPERHRRWTGRDNVVIHSNLRRLAALRPGPELLARVPLVPGVTDDAENLRALAVLAREAGLSRLVLLPYNPLWIAKRQAFGLPMPYAHATWMSSEQIARCAAVVQSEGVEV
jgi:pyruvate formate lyase activating enzyme